MVVRRLAGIISTAVMMMIGGCTGETPCFDEFVGIWTSVDGAVFHLDTDGTFTMNDVPGESIFPGRDEYSGTRLTESGRWEFKKPQGQWAIELTFDRSDEFKWGYAGVRLMISGHGILENRPPWYLYLWSELDGGPRYEFHKKVPDGSGPE